MTQASRFYTEGDYLVVFLDDEVSAGESVQIKPLNTLFWKRFATLSLVVVAILISYKWFVERVIYTEELLVSACALAAVSICLLLVKRNAKGWRWFRWVFMVASLLLVGLLIASSATHFARQRMAMRWLTRSGAMVVGFEPRTMLFWVLGESLGEFTLRQRAVDVYLPNLALPASILKDLHCENTRIVLTPSMSGDNRSLAIRTILNEINRGAEITFEVEHIDELGDEVLVSLEAMGIGFPKLKVRSPLTAEQADYLCSPNVPKFQSLQLEAFRLADFEKLPLSKITKSKSEVLELVDCQIDEATLPNITAIGRTFRIVESKLLPESDAGVALGLTSLRLLVEWQLPVASIKCALLSDAQCELIAKLHSLKVLELERISENNILQLARTNVNTLFLADLDKSAILTMLNSRVQWAIEAEQTDADFETVAELARMPWLRQFRLKNKAQFSPAQRVQLGR